MSAALWRVFLLAEIPLFVSPYRRPAPCRFGLACLRLILFRNSTHDGIAHDIAAAVNHIGGGVCKNAGGEPACLSIGSKIHVLIGRALLGKHILRLRDR